MDAIPEERLARIEEGLAVLLRALEPIISAWERFGPDLERRLTNPASRWRHKTHG
jgi:hypothetical protein